LIPEQGMEDSILGYFDNYPRKNVKNVQKYNNHANNLSAIYNAIIFKYPGREICSSGNIIELFGHHFLVIIQP
jgi:hypothetical protein